MFFFSTHPLRPSKFDSRSTECVFLGYPHGQNGYKIYSLKDKKTIVSRDVIFFKTEFPYQDRTPTSLTPDNSQPLTHLFPSSFNSSQTDHHLSPHLFESEFDSNPITPCLPGPQSDSNPDSTISSSTVSPTIHSPIISDSFVSQEIAPQPQRSTRATRMPTTLQGFHIESTLPSRPTLSSSTSEVQPLGTPHSISHVLSYDILSPTHKAFTVNLSLGKEPQSFSQAVLEPKWREAMNQEIQTLQANKTWSLVPLPPTRNQLAVSGSLRSNVILMAPWNVTRLV